ncbi:MAG: VWA domain-containing protein, partial [Gammaproteobacteria bacterium]
MIDIMDSIDKLQFLRPEWFFAFIPLVLYIVFAVRRKTTSVSWQAVCDANLLPHLLSDTTHKHSRWPLFIIALASSLGIIAMAGPVLHKLPQPVFREMSSLVIALDVSQSMDAADIKPSRLERAKLKLLDILAMRKGGQTALIVYAADAFTVTPLTDDTATIANLVPALETSLMPAQGSRATKAIKKARELLQQSGASNGDILLMTDGIRASDLDAIEPLPAQNIRLSMLGFGTPEGGPIPLETGFLQDRNGAIVIPKLEPGLLQSAAKLGGGLYLNMQADDTDIKRLGKLFNNVRARQHSAATELTADSWREEGPWLLLLVIPLAALGARRGWLASVVLLFMSIQIPQPAYAADNMLDALKLDPQYLWLTPDQKAARSLEQGDAASAADMFQQPHWKAAAQYRAGQYEQALNTLPEAQSADTYYNRGNALAQLKRYEEALAAYDEALKLAPDLDDAKFNRDLVEKELEKQRA